VSDWSVVPDQQAGPAAASEWSVVDQASQAPAAAPGPSLASAIGRGALQGATLGFSDEISGALESLFTDKSYKQARDESRAANQAAAEAHPVATAASELGAGLLTPIPGLGAIKGAGIAAHAARGAIAGGVAGLGGSNAEDFRTQATDAIGSALLGGAIGAVGGGIGNALSKSGAKSDELAIKALAGAESNESRAAWQKSKRMVNNPETKQILSEPVKVTSESGKASTTSLRDVAGAEPDKIQEVVQHQVDKIGQETRPIYARADEKSGGVKVSDYIKFLDNEVAKTSEMAPAEAKVYRNAIAELKENALDQWAPNLKAAMGSQEASNPQVREAILKQLDVKVPHEDVRAEATALQKIGFKTVDPLNPGLNTQVKRDMGNMVRDFVNEHVMQVLGGEDHSRLLSLNKRMNAWLGVGTVAEARAEKAAAGSMSGRGLLHGALGHGSITAGVTGAMMGHPAALALPLTVKALEKAPAAIRGVTNVAAKADARLAQVAAAAKAGNPFAQALVSRIQQAPGGLARMSALEATRGGGQVGPTD